MEITPPLKSAIHTGDVVGLEDLIRQDRLLCTVEGMTEILKYLVLAGKDVSCRAELAQILIDSGAEVTGALIAAGGVDNVVVAEVLLDAGAPINGDGKWSPIEEGLYFGQPNIVEMLVRRGASVHNLRIAAGLGEIDRINAFFTPEGQLKEEAGEIAWPFGPIPEDQHATTGQDVIDHALVYAGMRGQMAAAERLLHYGAALNVCPPGFEYRGTVLHYAAIRGHAELVRYLVERGADKALKDDTLGQLPKDWALFEGHEYIELI